VSDWEVGQVRATVRNRAWSAWAKALGEKASHKKREADAVALIRTVIFLSYLTTNAFIIAGVIRHWNDIEYARPSLHDGTKLHNQTDHKVNNDRHN
jgi:hypothetical protein